MKRQRLRALVLSAGFGTRLRPLSLFAPKPLLPVCGEPIAGRTLRRLKLVGCELAVLNMHYLASYIPEYFGRSYYGLPLHFSYEEEILGTYGALFAPRDVLAPADAVLMVNGDSLCRWPLKALVKKHFRSGADATLLLHRRSPDKALGGGISVDDQGRVCQFRDYAGQGQAKSRHIFTGAQIISTRLLDRIENRVGDIITDLYQPLLEEGRLISSLITGRRWHDLGTPSRYLDANLDWARGFQPSRLWRSNVLSPLAEIRPGTKISRSIIDQDAVVGKGATIQGSLVMEGAIVGEDCRAHHSIIGPGVELAPSSTVEHRMINVFDKRHELSPGESVMGDLVYTPLKSG